MKKWWLWCALSVLVLLSIAAAPPRQGQVTYQRYDVDIDIQADGSLWVTETYQMGFDGAFHTGFAEIPLSYVSDIRQVQVSEDGVPYQPGGTGPGTFDVSREWDQLLVDWEYEYTDGAEVRTFSVSYQVLGGLYIYPSGDMLLWTAVPQDRSGILVEESRVTIHLPRPVSPALLATLAIDGDATIEQVNDQLVIFDLNAPLPDGVAFEIGVGMPSGLTGASVTEWQRAIDELATVYRWPALAVDLTLEPDGTLLVHESHTLAVDEGYLYHGYRQIPWSFLDRIVDATVWQGERPFSSSSDPCDFCYVVEHDPGQQPWIRFNGQEVQVEEKAAGSTLIEWQFPALAAGEDATFDLHYRVLGAIRVLTDTQVISWEPVFAEREVAIDSAMVTLHLPPGVASDQVELKGGEVSTGPDGALQVRHQGAVDPSQSWSVSITLPAGATTTAKPAWQDLLEQALAEQEALLTARREAEVRRARTQLAAGLLGIALPVVGLAVLVLVWYQWGRDRPAPVVAQYVSKPPSGLPPGVVAYLVDEEPTVKGVLADLFYLATLGLISVDMRQPPFTIRLNWDQEIAVDQELQIAEGEPIRLAEHERSLFNALVRGIDDGQTALPWSSVEPLLVNVLPAVYQQMGDAATAYFAGRPEAARRRWNWSGQRVLLAAVVLGGAGFCAASSWGPVAFAPPAGLALLGLMLMGVSRWMPQRTTLGVEEAARWRAFQRYLRDLKRHQDLAATQKVLDRYFPYAVALDVDQVVLEQAAEMGSLIPLWMAPLPLRVRSVAAPQQRRRLLLPARRERGDHKDALGRLNRVRPTLFERTPAATRSLADLSKQLGRSLDGASRSLGDLLNTAVSDVEPSPLQAVVKGSTIAGKTTLTVLGEILRESSSGGGGSGGYSGGSSYRSSSWSSSSRSSTSSSSSRPSSGGGRRGFG